MSRYINKPQQFISPSGRIFQMSLTHIRRSIGAFYLSNYDSKTCGIVDEKGDMLSEIVKFETGQWDSEESVREKLIADTFIEDCRFGEWKLRDEWREHIQWRIGDLQREIDLLAELRDGEEPSELFHAMTVMF